MANPFRYFLLFSLLFFSCKEDVQSQKDDIYEIEADNADVKQPEIIADSISPIKTQIEETKIK